LKEKILEITRAYIALREELSSEKAKDLSYRQDYRINEFTLYSVRH